MRPDETKLHPSLAGAMRHVNKAGIGAMRRGAAGRRIRNGDTTTVCNGRRAGR